MDRRVGLSFRLLTNTNSGPTDTVENAGVALHFGFYYLSLVNSGMHPALTYLSVTVL
jgi:hypothetical protein